MAKGRKTRTPVKPQTREEEQLQRESDERAGFNDRLEQFYAQ